MAKKSGNKALLLDTHILLWLSQGDPRLTESAQSEIEKASRRREICLSVITLWEIGYLVGKERIKLSVELPTFWDQALTRLRAAQLDITASDVIAYHSLPVDFHNDPGDRFLVAQARTRGLRMMTADGRILAIRDQLEPAYVVAVSAQSL
ncbi:type II toxin-antitoxin system VapC family toxin [Oligoflexus tunisiensis]|uniref:type II toxin-antitoxin system VapC family toxin n=1 Tax=Oligoflexus tunisiensis TaxID=708132 RepID=UPI00159F0BE2|nr:type II toxin-antitoxin system VapC family toxin [Oligoflexus tunisiensis]